jgi:hypothetical protein
MVHSTIKHIELPYYDCDPIAEKDSLQKLERLKEIYGVGFAFTMEDAVKSTQPDLITATTNCGDSSVAFGILTTLNESC